MPYLKVKRSTKSPNLIMCLSEEDKKAFLALPRILKVLEAARKVEPNLCFSQWCEHEYDCRQPSDEYKEMQTAIKELDEKHGEEQ